jgi:putative ABC transport system permease protein
MLWPRKLILRLQSLFRRTQNSARLDDELQFHLDQQIAENIAAGMSREDARYSAMRTFGNPTSLKEQTRDTWGWIWLEQVAQDVRYGLRLLLKNRSFTFVAVFTLALGIAGTATLWSIFDGAYIHFGETPQANRSVLLMQHLKDQPDASRFSAPEYLDIAVLKQYQFFDGFFAMGDLSATLSQNLAQNGEPDYVHVLRTTSNMFPLYGITAMLGRTYTAEDDRLGEQDVAVLTYRLWNEHFAKDPNVVGKTIYLNRTPYTIIGVTPRRSQHWGADVYAPLKMDPAATDRRQRDLRIAGITKAGVSTDQATPEISFLASREAKQFQATNPEYVGLLYEPEDVRKVVIGDLRIALYMLMGAVALLALITAANVASLLLARTMARAGEIGTRLALGAAPARLMRQFLIESVVLSAIAGVAGLLAGVLALKPLLAIIPNRYIGDEADVHTSAPALVIAFLVALISGALFGLAPALLVSRRGAAANLQQSRTRSATDRRSSRLRAALVLVEISLGFIVVMAAGLMVRTYQRVTSMNLGFRPDHVLTMMFSLPESKYPGGTDLAQFSREVLRRVQTLPGIVSVSASSNRPAGSNLRFHDFSIPGRSLNAADGISSAAYRLITPQYFAVIGTALREGRWFADNDIPESAAVAVVNQSFAQTYFPGEEVVGKQIKLENRNANLAPATNAHQAGSNDVLQIVGIVSDARQIEYWQDMSDLNKPIVPEIFVPLWQHPDAVREPALLVRTAVDPGTVTDSVRREVLAVDSERPAFSIDTLGDLADLAVGPTRVCLLILGTFAAVALLTACVGLYAIVSYSVAQRTHEIGIRIALGANQRDVLRLVARDGIPVVAVGLLVGLASSLGLTRLMSSIVYGVSANDGVTLLAVSALLTATAILAVYIPARRAMRVDPMTALKYE